MTNDTENPHVNGETVGNNGEALFTKKQIEDAEALDHGGTACTKTVIVLAEHV